MTRFTSPKAKGGKSTHLVDDRLALCKEDYFLPPCLWMIGQTSVLKEEVLLRINGLKSDPIPFPFGGSEFESYRIMIFILATYWSRKIVYRLAYHCGGWWS